MLHLDLPAAVHDAMAGRTATPAVPTQTSSPSSADPSSSGDPSMPADPASHDAWPWLLGLLIFLGATALLVRSLRPR